MPENNMVVALMDEYRRSVLDLNEILAEISDEDFLKIRDFKTEDASCESIQTVVSHLVQSGYTYINYINTISKIEWKEYETEILTPVVGIQEIDAMLDFTQASLQHILPFGNEEIESWKFESRWGVVYDFEQLMEHAIVHILRHRRQIEKFLGK